MEFGVLMPGDESAVRAIYEESFPLAVRAPWENIRQHRTDEDLLVLRDPKGVSGFALSRRLGDTALVFVRYLAIDPTRRGEGLGSQLVAHLTRHYAATGFDALLLDVETPLGEHASDDRRRITFYEREGLALLDVPDYAPPAHGETDEEVPLLLMGIALGAGAPLEDERLQDAVTAVYRYRYGIDDPALS